MQLKSALGLTAIVSTIGSIALCPASGSAQAIFGNQSLNNKFNQTYYRNEPDFFQNRDLLEQIGFLFSVYQPENRISADGHAVDRLYRDAFHQQLGDRVIRTADLPSPFTGSLLTTPLVSESPLPPPPPTPYVRPAPPPEQPAAAPAPAPTTRQRPVPALW